MKSIDVTEILSFNTTLVQLKEGIPRKVAPSGSMFQYHTGPIKRQSGYLEVSSPVPRFNTTLVQLKACVLWLDEIEKGVGFQYHTGPIKSPAPSLLGSTHSQVSIPHWSN